MSTIRDASLNALKAASNAVSQVNIPGKLPVIAETSKEFAVQYLAKPTAQGAQWASAEGTKLAGWAAANPVTTAAGAAGLLIIAAPALAAAPVLSAVGFGANGIVAGSMAAGVQSGMGSVVAPSVFATLQSAGAGGYGIATVYPIVQAFGGAIASSAGGFAAWVKSKQCDVAGHSDAVVAMADEIPPEQLDPSNVPLQEPPPV